MASPSDPLVGRMFQGVDKKSAAFKLMKSMGWEEGSGLGKNKQGINTHVRVAKKHDNYGLGIAEAKKSTSEWTVNTAVFDTILKNLQIHAISSGTNNKDKSKEEGSDDEPSSNTDTANDSSDSESEEEEDLPKSISAKKLPPVKIARPQGRYKKREAGKAVSSYSASDLNAILGHGATAIETPPAKPVSVAQSADTEPSPSLPMKLLPAVTPVQLPALPSDWWGTKYGFVRAGHLGSAAEPKQDPVTAGKVEGAPLVVGFREEDQENLYNLVQDNATSGKRGLGIADMPKKVAGARWKGSKVTFGENEADNGLEGAEAVRNGVSEVAEKQEKRKRVAVEDSDCKEGEKKGKKGKKGGKDESLVSGVDGNEAGAGSEAAGAVKWKKIILDLVKESDGQRISVKTLRKKAIVLAKEWLGGVEVPRSDLAMAFSAKLNTIKRVQVSNEYVELLPAGNK